MITPKRFRKRRLVWLYGLDGRYSGRDRLMGLAKTTEDPVAEGN